ncbi:hypothetical protein P3X46_023336 [Hevea brasiliensis]|uniref:Cdc23 domain-containing protein n=1 Tax=Hevea brasiliensis TaxID=3981 RepID=A0ABQ9LCJ6_HEVBR|nr:hypothetical protein P3X46_023336 [Hevea brasiliensis]
MSSRESCRSELRTAIRQLSDRFLYSASKCGFQVVVIAQDPAKFTPSNTRFQRGNSSIRRRFCTNDIPSTLPAGVSYVSTPVMAEDEAYRRAAHVLRDQTGKKAVFLRCYALYLAGEKRKEEEMIELEGPLGKSDTVNRKVVSLERKLSALCKNGTIDPFGLYLYGLVLKEKGNQNLACTVLQESVNSYPWNWSAWLELQSLCTTVENLNGLTLSNHWMKDFFLASAYQELRTHNESRAKYEYLQSTFSFIEDLDMYSNVLYEKECFSALSYLAHREFVTDKYRPESCCIIGNYYNLKGQHEKSVVYFRRALKLNKNYLSAWTLMGHEYCYETDQLHMLEEAIKCYRKAANSNDREAIALHQLAKLHAELGRSEEAALYYKDSERMEAEKREGPNMVEALLFLAQHCREQKRFEEAEITAESSFPLVDFEHCHP